MKFCRISGKKEKWTTPRRQAYEIETSVARDLGHLYVGHGVQ
jgi:hypothetical protein